MTDSYPERRPEVAPLASFTFSLDAAKAVAEDLRPQIEAMEQRIVSLTERTALKNVPVLTHILNLSHDEDELTVLGEAIKRLAPLMATYDELLRRKAVIDFATEDPNWMATTFGDFSADSERLNTALDELDPPQE